MYHKVPNLGTAHVCEAYPDFPCIHSSIHTDTRDQLAAIQKEPQVRPGHKIYIYIYIYIYMYICTCILVTERVCLPRRQCRVLWHSGSQISSRRFGINPEFHQLKERLPLSSAVFYFSGFLPSMPAFFSLDKFVDLTGHLRGRGNRTQLAVLEVLIAVW
jgi:preprotein translocase subunit SecY